MSSRIAVLASGGGSNLQAILEHLDALGERRGGHVVVVASDKPGTGALEKAAQRDIPTAVLRSDKRPDGEHLSALIDTHAVDLIVLAGYLKLVPPEVVRAFEGRIVNVHPALLPAFGGHGMYGHRVHQAVIESGAKVSGVTVHFVDDAYDRGRIIAQWPVPVFQGDDAGTLAARVLRVEHLLFPRVVDAVAAGRTTLANCGPVGSPFIDARSSFTLFSHEESRLAENIELVLGS